MTDETILQAVAPLQAQAARRVQPASPAKVAAETMVVDAVATMATEAKAVDAVATAGAGDQVADVAGPVAVVLVVLVAVAPVLQEGDLAVDLVVTKEAAGDEKAPL